MGNRQPWYKMWSDQVLADQKVLRLSWPAKGVFWIMLCILRTQTDKPGYFIEDGKSLTLEEIIARLKLYSGRTHSGLKYASVWTQQILDLGLIERLSDGTYYSPRIVEEVEESMRNREAGKQSAAQRVQQSVQQSVQPEEEEEEEKRGVQRKQPQYRSPVPIDQTPEAIRNREAAER